MTLVHLLSQPEPSLCIFPLYIYITIRCISYGCPSFELGHALLLWQVGRHLLNFSPHAQPLKIELLSELSGFWTAPPHESQSGGPPPFVSAPAPDKVWVMAHIKGRIAFKKLGFFTGYLWRSAWRDAPYFVWAGGRVCYHWYSSKFIRI